MRWPEALRLGQNMQAAALRKSEDYLERQR